jgi:release factor glutamine methyltransferase
LIQVLRTRAPLIRGAGVLEIGSGSGVVLAAIGDLGAASLCGVDIEETAVTATTALLHELGHGDKADIHRGNMWQPLGSRRFDLIAANLPHFPMEPWPCNGRLPTWSAGGSDGRLLLDAFIAGLRDHLRPGGRAIITHNAFVDLQTTRDRLMQAGLSLHIAMTVTVAIHREKLDLMSRNILAAEEGRSIFRHGPYAFGEMHIVEIGVDVA